MTNKTLEKWEEKTLEDILDKSSSNLSANKLNACEGDYPVYGASGLVKKVNFYQQEKEYLAIIKDGAGVGRVYHYEPKSSILGTLQYLFPKENVNIRFAYYYLQSLDFAKYYQGAAIPHIYYKDYKNEKLVLPPLSEQQRIVKILDKAFENIENSKQNALQNLNNTKELFENSLNNIFKNIKTSTNQEILQNIYDVINGYSFKSQDFNCNNSIKVVKITNVGVKEFVEENNDKLPEDFIAKYKNFVINTNDIVIALTRTIISGGLKVAIVPNSFDNALLNQRVACIKSSNNNSCKYLYYYLQTHDVYCYVKSKVNELMQPNLSINDLKNMPVPVAEYNTQHKIVQQLDELQEQVKKLEQIYEQKIKDLDELKRSILQKAFNGEL